VNDNYTKQIMVTVAIDPHLSGEMVDSMRYCLNSECHHGEFRRNEKALRDDANTVRWL